MKSRTRWSLVSNGLLRKAFSAKRTCEASDSTSLTSHCTLTPSIVEVVKLFQQLVVVFMLVLSLHNPDLWNLCTCAKFRLILFCFIFYIICKSVSLNFFVVSIAVSRGCCWWYLRCVESQTWSRIRRNASDWHAHVRS